mgnify:CR=1 FL=1
MSPPTRNTSQHISLHDLACCSSNPSLYFPRRTVRRIEGARRLCDVRLQSLTLHRLKDQRMSIELKQRVQELNLELEKYKKMTQYGLTLSSLEQSDAHRRSHQQMTTMNRRFKVPSQS